MAFWHAAGARRRAMNPRSTSKTAALTDPNSNPPPQTDAHLHACNVLVHNERCRSGSPPTAVAGGAGGGCPTARVVIKHDKHSPPALIPLTHSRPTLPPSLPPPTQAPSAVVGRRCACVWWIGELGPCLITSRDAFEEEENGRGDSCVCVLSCSLTSRSSSRHRKDGQMVSLRGDGVRLLDCE